MTAILSDQIADSGEATSTLDLLRKISPPSPVSRGKRDDQHGRNLRRFLINLHGCRADPGERPPRGHVRAEAVGGDRFEDLNMIPVGAIDSIEVLATALPPLRLRGGRGVINVKLKKTSTLEANAHYGRSDNTGNYAEQSYSLVGGVSNGKTTVTIAAEYASMTDHVQPAPVHEPLLCQRLHPGVIDIYNIATNVDESTR